MRFVEKTLYIVWLLITVPVCYAEQYYVSPVGDDSNSGRSNAPWRTIGMANASARAGDTVTIRGGEYREAINPQASGTVSSPITYVAQAGENVVLTSPPSDAEGKKTAIRLAGRNYIVIDGITVDGKRLSGGGDDAEVDSFIRMVNAHNNTVRNCTFRFANGNAGVHIHGGSSHNRIVNNTFDAVGTNHIPDGYPNAGNDRGDTLVIKNASHNLVEGNNFSRGGHNSIDIIGSYNVIRGNVFDGRWSGTDSPGARAAGALSANTKFGVPEPRGFNLFESNVLKNAGASSDNPENVALKVQGMNQIVRGNYFFDNGSAAISASTREGSTERVVSNRIYNNTFYRNESLFIYRDYGHNLPFFDNVWKNNIVAGLTGDVQVVINFTTLARRNADATDEIENTKIAGNLFEEAPNGGDAIFRVKVGGTFVSEDIQTMAGRYPSNLFGNFTAEVPFVNASSRTKEGFNVQSGSPAIDSGVALTRTLGSGSGTVVRVDDAGYFYDGFGISGEEGDEIRIGNSPPVRVARIDYIANTLILASSTQWSSGEAVNLSYTGEGPDIGAQEISGSLHSVSNSQVPLPPVMFAN